MTTRRLKKHILVYILLTKRIKVGLIGIGNCFSGLLQGIEYYHMSHDQIIGLINEKIAGYSIFDIDFVE